MYCAAIIATGVNGRRNSTRCGSRCVAFNSVRRTIDRAHEGTRLHCRDNKTKIDRLRKVLEIGRKALAVAEPNERLRVIS